MTNFVSKLETENVCIVFLFLLYFSYYTLLLTEFSLRYIVDDRIWKKHFALFIINIGVQRLRVPNFVIICFLCLLVTFFVAWFWRNMYVIFQTLTNAVKLIPWKWTNAIRMPLALIHRAHTTVLVFLDTLGMVLSVKVRLISAMPLN